jgi:hypothetical protein
MGSEWDSRFGELTPSDLALYLKQSKRMKNTPLKLDFLRIIKKQIARIHASDQLTNLCEAELEFTRAVIADERSERISHYKRASEFYQIAGDIDRSDKAKARMLKLEGIQAQHSLELDSAEERFKRALATKDAINERNEGKRQEPTNWEEGALKEVEATLILERVWHGRPSKILKEYKKASDLYKEAADWYSKPEDEDEERRDFCMEWHYRLAFQADPSHSRHLWQKAEKLKRKFETKNPPSRRRMMHEALEFSAYSAFMREMEDAETLVQGVNRMFGDLEPILQSRFKPPGKPLPVEAFFTADNRNNAPPRLPKLGIPVPPAMGKVCEEIFKPEKHLSRMRELKTPDEVEKARQQIRKHALQLAQLINDDLVRERDTLLKQL